MQPKNLIEENSRKKYLKRAKISKTRSQTRKK